MTGDLRDAAAGDRRAVRARVGQGQDRRADARDPAPRRAVAAWRRRHGQARRADGDRRLRRPRRPTAARGPRRSPAATSRWRPRSSPTAWSATSSGTSPRCGSGSSTASKYLDLDYSEDSRAEVDFNVVGTDAGAYVELQGTAEGKPFDRASLDELLDLANAGLAPAVRGADRGPRDGPPLRRGRRGTSWSRPAPRTSCRELRELLGLADVELVAPDDVGIEGEPDETGATFETNAAIKARYYARAVGPADARRRLRARGRRARRRTRRRHAALLRPGRHRRVQQREAAAGLDGLPADRRGGRYVCVLALALPGEAGPRGGLRLLLRRGTCRGRIATGRGATAASATTHLRALVRAAGRQDAGRVDRGAEARDLAPVARGGTDAADAAGARPLAVAHCPDPATVPDMPTPEGPRLPSWTIRRPVNDAATRRPVPSSCGCRR